MCTKKEEISMAYVNYIQFKSRSLNTILNEML